MADTKKIECRKCLGKGRIHGYSHILNGVCFACDGKGYQTVKANYKPSAMYSVKIYFDHIDGIGTVFGLRARSEAEAKRKAKAQLLRGCYADQADTFTVEKR